MTIRSAELQAWLRRKWQALTTSVAADAAAADSVWNDLVHRYSEPHRRYHSLSHIAALLRHAEAQRAHIAHPELVDFAIWFHDVIYDTHAKDNERLSAEWARCAMTAMQIDDRHIPCVMACIAATDGHKITLPEIVDMSLFLDIDLSVLGASPDVYQQYSQAIRQEYDWVPLDQYRAGRSQVLQKFLQRPALYFTPTMADQFEQQARVNLASELRSLAV
jgi:predicted metal-dependent HD superfamily phosphohydrolase